MLVLTTLGYFIVIFALVESPKWYLIVGKREEAIVNLNAIAKINGKNYKGILPNTRFIEELAEI